MGCVCVSVSVSVSVCYSQLASWLDWLDWPQMQCVNLGETEALLLPLTGLARSAAFRFLALAISAALRLRHLVRLFWNQTWRAEAEAEVEVSASWSQCEHTQTSESKQSKIICKIIETEREREFWLD